MPSDIDNLLIERTATIKETMRAIDKNFRRIIFVLDVDGKLAGTVTDGDIRRWILNNGDLNDSIEKAMNRSPLYYEGKYDLEEIKKVMLSREIESIPIVDENKRVIKVLFWDELFGNVKKKYSQPKNIPVVIMTGGKGTRLDPFTRILPKALIPIGQKAMIEVLMDNFSAFGYGKFYLIVNHKGEMIKSYLDNIESDYKLSYLWEKQPLGTAGGLALINDDIDSESFFVSNCDTLIKTDFDEIYDFHLKMNSDITIVGSLQCYKVPYGVIKVGKENVLEEIIEKPELDFLVNTGLYVLNKRVLGLIPEGQQFHLTDLINKVMQTKGKISVYPVSEGEWVDAGQWEEYRKAISSIMEQ